MDKCPCEECISFAICYQKTAIHCQDLYEFLCYVNGSGFKGYKPESGDEITRLYKRYITSTQYRSNRIRLTRNSNYKAFSIYGGDGEYIPM